ncbi:pescadillo homolog isoform X6 [Embiotoca jacksoni]|uniref:pescadillo homolog isoform X6 n=1 Tax=Embiotoca jacksoni TaxID=100190 RepID=UPI003704BAED
MDIQRQYRKHLEPIYEVTEPEDETEVRTTGDEAEEDFPFQEVLETKDELAEDKSEEQEDEDEEEEEQQQQQEQDEEEEKEEDDDDDGLLRVMRPKKLSHSINQENSIQMQSTHNQQKEMYNFSVSDWTTHAVDPSDEAAPPGLPRLWNEKRSSSSKLRIKISESRQQKQTPHKPSVEKSKKSHKKKLQREEPFPQWLVDLMINIEEATTHQLVVE